MLTLFTWFYYCYDLCFCDKFGYFSVLFCYVSVLCFFLSVSLQTFMNSGMTTMTVCFLQKLWHGHNDCVLQELGGDRLC